MFEKTKSLGKIPFIHEANGSLPANYLFFDEPTSALDNLNKNHFINEMQNLKIDKIIFIVTHDIEMLKHTDHVVVMNKGEFEFSGDYADAEKKSLIIQKLISQNE